MMFPEYSQREVVDTLTRRGYVVDEVAENEYKGVMGYLHATDSDADNEVYIIYCANPKIARTIYVYIKRMHKADIAKLKMNMERIDYAINRAEDLESEAKGKYYAQYVEMEEELESYKKYRYGHYSNVVWYGTKQAIEDTK